VGPDEASILKKCGRIVFRRREMTLTFTRTWRPLSVVWLVLLVQLSQPGGAVAQASGTFIPTGNLMTPRGYGHTATLLQNGKVLISGGVNDCCHVLPSAELFDPVTGTFTPTGNMTVGRSHHSATLLLDGRVLIAGGGGPGSLATAELYDSSTGIFTPTGNMVTGAGCAYCHAPEQRKGIDYRRNY
jgi:hypothetical protein